MRRFGNNSNGEWLLLILSALVLIFPVGAGQTPPPDLLSMPEVARIWMGMEEGSVRPASYQQIRSDVEGPLQFHCEDGALLERGTHWATVDAEQLDLEREAIGLEELKLERQIMKAEDDAEEARLRNLLEMRETEKKLMDLRNAMRESDVPPAMRKRAVDAAADLESRLSMLQKRVDPALVAKQLETDRQEARLLLERKRKQHEQLRRRSLLMAENQGQIRFSDPIRKKISNAAVDGSAVWIKAGDHLATITDEKNLEIVVPASGQVMSLIAQKDLAVLLQDGRSGKLIEGRYLRTEETDTGLEISRNYVFSIPQEAVADARAAMGQRHLAHVYRQFDGKFRLVQKSDIAFLAPHVLEKDGWDGLARSLWPGCTVIQVGPQTLAIEPPNAN